MQDNIMPDQEKQLAAPFRTSVMIALLAVITIFSGAVVYIYEIRASLEADARAHINYAAKQETNIINQQFRTETQILAALAAGLERYGNLHDIKAASELLKQECKNTDFKDTGLLLPPDGEEYFTENSVAPPPMPADLFARMMESNGPVFSNRIKDPAGGRNIIMQAMPVHENNKIKAILFATQDARYYANLLREYNTDGKGSSYIVRSNGDLVINTAGPDKAEGFSAILQQGPQIIFDDKNINAASISEGLAQRKSGLVSYRRDGMRRYANYEPLSVNDWVLISVTPADILSSRTGKILRFSLLLCAGAVFVFTCLLVYILWLRRTNRQDLLKLAFTDPLSDTRNLNKFALDLPRLLKDREGSRFALIEMDINKFKVINDFYGYKRGNNVLIYVADILKKSLSSKEISARIHADVFAFVLEYKTEDAIIKRLEEITDKIKNFYTPEGHNYGLNVSYGIYKIGKGLPFFLMLDRANIARAAAKKRNDNKNYEFYRESSFKKILSEKNIEKYMARGIKEEQFLIYMQPKYDFRTSKINSAEALVRWQHPEQGLLYPASFIPVFEQNGFITNLDMYILEGIGKKIRHWLDNDITPLPISVNLSRLHLNNPLYLRELKRIVHKYSIDPRWIELELTESVVFENTDAIRLFIKDLHAMGFSVAMDDFGSGYSSLNLLKNLPFDTLKLDKEFLTGINNNDRAKEIIRGTVRMLKNLNAVIVAEGVETKEQAEFLQETGCDMAQGYFVARPMPGEEFELLLKNMKQ